MSRSPPRSVNVNIDAENDLIFSGPHGPSSCVQASYLHPHPHDEFRHGTQAPAAHPHADDLAIETDDVRAHMSIALEEHLPPHADRDRDMAAGFLQPAKLSIETSTSPKPCIVPGNALQLIDDDPASASRSHTPSSVTIVDEDPRAAQDGAEYEHGHEHDGPTGDEDEDEGEGETRRPAPRVRFRSRVRITSGLRRGRHHTDPTSTPSSSTSGSPSSSISVPLRWQADENATWGPIGRRLSTFAQAGGWPRRSPSVAGAGVGVRGKYDRRGGAGAGVGGENGQVPAVVGANGAARRKTKTDGEREPLLGSVRRLAYVDAGLDGGWLVDDGAALVRHGADDADEELAAVDEEAFGPWPWRIFNRHWWWRHAEPVLCCCCADESDEGE